MTITKTQINAKFKEIGLQTVFYSKSNDRDVKIKHGNVYAKGFYLGSTGPLDVTTIRRDSIKENVNKVIVAIENFGGEVNVITPHSLMNVIFNKGDKKELRYVLFVDTVTNFGHNSGYQSYWLFVRQETKGEE